MTHTVSINRIKKSAHYLLLRLYAHRPTQAIGYFSQMALGNGTVVKYGFVADNISIIFIIAGKPRQRNLSISRKPHRLRDTTSNLTALNDYLPNMKNPVKFHFPPYLKINHQAGMSAARIGTEHKTTAQKL